MKKVLLGLCVSFFIISCGEKEVNLTTLQKRNDVYYEVNQTKPFNGKVKDFYKNGQIKLEGTIKNGEFIGTKKIYYENGQIEAIIKHDNSKISNYESYYENGQLHMKISFNKDSKPKGLTEVYYENGIKKFKANYSDNGILLDKNVVIYRNDGSEIINMIIENGVPDQEIQIKNKNGIKSFVASVKNGALDGEFQEFNSDGKLIYKGIYNNNKLEGIVGIYNGYNDTLTDELSFKDNKLNGVSKFNINTPSKLKEIEFENDKEKNKYRSKLENLEVAMCIQKAAFFMVLTSEQGIIFRYNEAYIKNPFALEKFGKILYPKITNEGSIK